MITSPDPIKDLQELERWADDVMGKILRAGQPAPDDLLTELKIIADSALTTADLSDNIKLLSEQMTALIAWTEPGRLDEPSWVARFQEALLSRPLVAPSK